MSSINIYLEAEECDAVRRYAEALGVSDEDIAYTALHRLMREAKTAEDDISREIVHFRQLRTSSHSPWSNPGSAGHDFAHPGDTASPRGTAWGE